MKNLNHRERRARSPSFLLTSQLNNLIVHQLISIATINRQRNESRYGSVADSNTRQHFISFREHHNAFKLEMI